MHNKKNTNNKIKVKNDDNTNVLLNSFEIIIEKRQEEVASSGDYYSVYVNEVIS